MRSKLFGLILYVCPLTVYAQPADSTVVFSYEAFYSIVMANHPIVRQAALLSEQAAQDLRVAQGAFDPRIEVNWNAKYYNGTEYYDKFRGALKIPIWFPVNPEIGIGQNSGTYLNPENFIPNGTDNRQLYAGVSVPVGRGLFIDERRALVRQSRLFQDMAEAEQVKTINGLLLTVARDYWDWYYAFNNYVLTAQGIEIAEDIFDRTRLAFEYGEAAALDTVQGFIALQNRLINFQQANIDRITAALSLSNHLWTKEGMPLELQDNARPEAVLLTDLSHSEMERLLRLARNNHPELKTLELRNEVLKIDQRLARENIKPRLDLGYYLLDQPFDGTGERTEFNPRDNYRIGVNFSFPLFLRKERAQINQVEFKMIDNNLERDFRERQIINNINAGYAELINTAGIVQRQQQMVAAYFAIVEAERLNLLNGESDLFRLNVQLDNFIESQSKLLRLNVSYKKNEAYLYWSAGTSIWEDAIND